MDVTLFWDHTVGLVDRYGLGGGGGELIDWDGSRRSGCLKLMVATSQPEDYELDACDFAQSQ